MPRGGHGGGGGHGGHHGGGHGGHGHRGGHGGRGRGGWRGGPGPRGRGRPMWGGPVFGGPPPPRPMVVPLVDPYYGRVAVAVPIVGGAVLAGDIATRRRRERELRLEEERQMAAAKAQSAREEEQRQAQLKLSEQQNQLHLQQKQMENQMKQLNLMKQQQQQQNSNSGASASYGYYGGSNVNASANSSYSQVEGQEINNNNNNNNNGTNYNQGQQKAAPNYGYYGGQAQAQPQPQVQSQQPKPQPVQSQVKPQVQYYGQQQQQQVSSYQQPGSNINYQNAQPQQAQQPQSQAQQAAPQSNVISYPDLKALKQSSNVVSSNEDAAPPPPSYSSHVAKQQPPQQQQQQPQGYTPQQPQQQQPGSFIKPPPPNDDEKYQHQQQEDEGPVSSVRGKQPLPDAQPTLKGLAMYSDSMALEDAKTLRKAMKGFGTKEGPIIQISGTRNREQRMKIIEQFTNVDSHLYNDNKHRDLIKDLKSELSGNLKDVILSLFMRAGEFDAHMIEEACAGAGYNQSLLIEVLCTRTNEELELMQYAWDHYSKKEHKTSLKERVHKETSKLFSVGNFQALMNCILDGKRDESRIVDKQLARQDAELLNRVITQDKKKEAKAKFVEIFSNRSWAHLRQLSNNFNEVSKKYTLIAAIARTFGESATSQAMRVIVEFSSQPYDFWAKRIRVAMKGIGTNDNLLKRVVISRCEIDLNSVAEVFGQRHGDGKTLGKWLKDDTGGHYKEILLYLTNYHN